VANKTSQHILSTAANLLGFCLFIITSFHLTDRSENSLIDEFTSVVALALTISSVFSFLSIRSDDARREVRLESVADIFFIISLAGIFLIIVFITLKFWMK